MKLKEVVTHAPELPITANSLQHLTQGQVGEAERLTCELTVQPMGCGVFAASQVVNPHGGVNDDHKQSLFQESAGAGFLKITFPPDLSSEPADGPLGVGVGKQFQGGFYGGFLGARAADLHGLAHEPVVDFNVGSHDILNV
jgi:hypothetical protein